MIHTLFISFDLIREGEIKTPLAIASILAFLRNDEQLLERMCFEHISINMLDYGSNARPTDFDNIPVIQNVRKFDFIAISAYIWNEYFINNFIKYLRELGFEGKIILGGYQISYADRNELTSLYPDSQFYVSGYAELSLKNIFTKSVTGDVQRFHSASVDFSEIPSPYISNEIKIPVGTKMLRLETKRGCPYRCSFCAHRDLTQNKVLKHPLEKVFEEVNFIKDKQVKRVNVLDPIFNAGREYIEMMKEINRLNFPTAFTLQSRFENIKGNSGSEFLDLCEAGNYHLEFGLQTAVVSESENINRKNNLDHIHQVMMQLADRSISYEVSLIYGLPGQTVDSFKRSIDFVQSRGCDVVKAYPLMLLRGTELFFEKAKWNIREDVVGEFNIPVVTSSGSFTRNDWEVMNEIANNLMSHNRL